MNPYFDNIIKKNEKDINQIKNIILSIIENEKIDSLYVLSEKLNENQFFFKEKIITEVGSSDFSLLGSNGYKFLIFNINESFIEEDFLFDYRFHETVLFDINFSNLEIKAVEVKLLTDYGYVSMAQENLCYSLKDRDSSEAYHEVMGFIFENNNCIKDDFYDFDYFESKFGILDLNNSTFQNEKAPLAILKKLDSASHFYPKVVLDYLFNNINIKEEVLEIFQLENDINIDLSNPNLNKIQFDTNKVKLNFSLNKKKNTKVNIIK